MDEDLHSNHVNAENPLYHNPARAVDNGGGDGAMGRRDEVQAESIRDHRQLPVCRLENETARSSHTILFVQELSLCDLFY